MITNITNAQTGMATRGAVSHLIKGVGTFGLTVSYCGRVVVAGESDARLCKTCVRLTGYVAPVKPSGDAWDMINNCASQHNHTNTDAWLRRKHSATALSMYRDVLSDYANGAENDACWIGTLMLVLDAPKLTLDTKVSDIATRQGKGGDGMINPNAKPARKRGCGASEKQEKLIRDLISQIRELNSDAADVLDTIYTDEWINETEWKKISAGIDALFAAKRSEEKKAREIKTEELAKPKSSREWRRNQVYVIDGVFHRVHISQTTGRPYTQSWADGVWSYEGMKFLPKCTDATACTAEQAKAWAHENDSCVFCHKPLDDQRSREAGYGSTCADNNGLPWGE